jgi:hypothetical protein
MRWFRSSLDQGECELLMPFRENYRHLYDASTLARLQDVFEFVWLATVDAGIVASRAHIARLIIEAHDAGMTPEGIKDSVLSKFATKRKPKNIFPFSR